MLGEEGFFESERQVFGVLRSVGFLPENIVDIGASDGSWTRACLDVFPNANYRLYEPLCSHLAHYKEGLEALIGSRRNVTLRTAGVADRSGASDFYITPDWVGSSLLPVGTAKKIEIEITTLDEDLAGMDVGPDILKMDTQGGELRILKGARTVIPRTRVVVIESWFYRGYGAPTPLAHEIVEEMLQYDFRLFTIGGPYFNPGNILYAVDLFFGRSDLLELLGPNPFRRG
jgi:FkbM family methyltransferase